jgi:hypothetical protein
MAEFVLCCRSGTALYKLLAGFVSCSTMPCMKMQHRGAGRPGFVSLWAPARECALASPEPGQPRKLVDGRALGLPSPAYFHCPLVMDPSTGIRLAKRSDALAIRALRDAGVCRCARHAELKHACSAWVGGLCAGSWQSSTSMARTAIMRGASCSPVCLLFSGDHAWPLAHALRRCDTRRRSGSPTA